MLVIGGVTTYLGTFTEVYEVVEIPRQKTSLQFRSPLPEFCPVSPKVPQAWDPYLLRLA